MSGISFEDLRRAVRDVFLQMGDDIRKENGEVKKDGAEKREN